MPTHRKRPRFQPPVGNKNFPSVDPYESVDQELETVDEQPPDIGQDSSNTRLGRPSEAPEVLAGSIDQQALRKLVERPVSTSQSGCIGVDGRITTFQPTRLDLRNPLGLVPKQYINGVWR